MNNLYLYIFLKAYILKTEKYPYFVNQLKFKFEIQESCGGYYEHFLVPITLRLEKSTSKFSKFSASQYCRIAEFNPFLPTVPTFAVRETDRQTSLGIMGEPRVPPLSPSETIVL